jgi:uncharacterized BrkB/YihY/UPF0761 family membrane protein
MGTSYLLLDTIKKSFGEWTKMPSQMGAAALSFFTIFSLTPLLILTLTIERQTAASCGAGPWTFTGSASNFVR